MYFLKRLLFMIPLLLFISLLAFVLVRVAPGGPFDKDRKPASPEIKRNIEAKYHLDQSCNVDEAGRLRNGLAEYEGKRVFDANASIVELLKNRKVLMGSEKIEHSYPHCWRCHNPVIFRATEQWFISMETPMPGGKSKNETLRSRTLL